MTDEQRNKDVVRSAIAAFNHRDIDRFFTYHTQDSTSHEVFFPEPLGREEFRAFLEEFIDAYPDAHIETVNMIAEGDTVVVENVLTATFERDLRGTRATGRSYRAHEAVVFELEDGRIHAARIYLDQKSVEKQLGIG
jgi:steroid delta-isomerase-like uncharacterized protein